MATFTADAAQSTVQPKALRVGLTAVDSVFTHAGTWSVSIATTIQMIKVPANARPVFISVGLTGATASQTIEVGDGNVTGRYRSHGTLTAAQGMIVAHPSVPGIQYTYSVDDTLDIYVSLVSGSSLGGSYYMTAIFSMDPQPH